MNRRIYSTFILFSFLLIVAGACSESAGKKDQGRMVTSVEAIVVKESPVSRTVRTTGNLLAWESVEIMSPVNGNVMQIMFNEGDHVKKGELLIRIDDRTWQARLKGLQAQLKSAENELERKKELLDMEGVSREEVEQTQASVENIKAEMDELKVMIDLASVEAPFRGRVGMRNFSPGAYLRQGQAITNLVQENPLRVDFSFPSKYAVNIRPGKPVNVINSATGDTVQAEIYAIDPQVNRDSRSLHARAKLDNPQGKYIPGDFSEIFFNIEQEEDALLVPAEAIIAEINGQVVFVYREGKARKQRIETGIRTPGEVQVLEGLEKGDTVVVTGLLDLNEGDSISIRTIKEEGAL